MPRNNHQVGKLVFRFLSRGLGIDAYQVTGDGEPYTVEMRYEASTYQRSIFRGGDDAWDRDVVASIGLLIRRGSSDIPIPANVVQAFNAWRRKEHVAEIVTIDGCPMLRPYLPLNDPMREFPLHAKGSYYVRDKGWIVQTSGSQARFSMAA